MEETEQKQTEEHLPPVSNTEAALRHFRMGLAAGKHWYIALLESIALWSDEEETVDGRDYRYLIAGEAFDWLLLAARICETANGKVPENEKFALLFQGKPPLMMSAEEFSSIIGKAKYRKYLNYFYGVTVEEALIQAVREEVRKERYANASGRRQGEDDEVFNRVYSDSNLSLLRQFRKEKHYHLLANSNLTQMKEFIYWCFKYRLRECEKAKVASDTSKAIDWLRRNGYSGLCSNQTF
jgi:hypothetical protein